MVKIFEKDFETSVKSYSRSASGQATSDPRSVRDINTLVRTVKHLLHQ